MTSAFATGSSNAAMFLSDRPSAGEYVPDRDLAVNTATLSGSGQLYLNYWTADKTELITNLAQVTASTAAGATPTLCRTGIYGVASDGSLTLVASIANDTTLWAAASTLYTRALTTPWQKVAGVRYATALLIVTGAAVPTFVGMQHVASIPSGNVLLAAPTKAAKVTGQTDLPATIAVGSLTAATARVQFRLT